MLFKLSPHLNGEDHAVLHTETVRQQCNHDHRTMEMATSKTALLASSIVLLVMLSQTSLTQLPVGIIVYCRQSQ